MQRLLDQMVIFFNLFLLTLLEQDTEFLKPSTITSASESKTEEALPTVEMPMLSSNDMNTLKNLQNDDTHKDTALQSQETSIVLTPIQALKQKQKHLIQSGKINHHWFFIYDFSSMVRKIRSIRRHSNLHFTSFSVPWKLSNGSC